MDNKWVTWVDEAPKMTSDELKWWTEACNIMSKKEKKMSKLAEAQSHTTNVCVGDGHGPWAAATGLPVSPYATCHPYGAGSTGTSTLSNVSPNGGSDFFAQKSYAHSQMANKSLPKKKGKKFWFTYRDPEGGYHDHIPSDVRKMKVYNANGQYKNFSLVDLPPEVVRYLAALQLGTLFTQEFKKMPVTVDSNGPNVDPTAWLLHAAEFFNTVAEGNFVTKNGKVIKNDLDIHFWREVALKVAQKKGMNVLPQNVDNFINDLKVMTEKAREKYIEVLKGDPQFKAAILEVELAKHAQDGTSTSVNAADHIFPQLNVV